MAQHLGGACAVIMVGIREPQTEEVAKILPVRLCICRGARASRKAGVGMWAVSSASLRANARVRIDGGWKLWDMSCTEMDETKKQSHGRKSGFARSDGGKCIPEHEQRLQQCAAFRLILERDNMTRSATFLGRLITA